VGGGWGAAGDGWWGVLGGVGPSLDFAEPQMPPRAPDLRGSWGFGGQRVLDAFVFGARHRARASTSSPVRRTRHHGLTRLGRVRRVGEKFAAGRPRAPQAGNLPFGGQGYRGADHGAEWSPEHQVRARPAIRSSSEYRSRHVLYWSRSPDGADCATVCGPTPDGRWRPAAALLTVPQRFQAWSTGRRPRRCDSDGLLALASEGTMLIATHQSELVPTVEVGRSKWWATETRGIRAAVGGARRS